MIHAEPFVTAVDGGGHEAAFGGWGGKGGQVDGCVVDANETQDGNLETCDNRWLWKCSVSACPLGNTPLHEAYTRLPPVLPLFLLAFAEWINPDSTAVQTVTFRLIVRRNKFVARLTQRILLYSKRQRMFVCQSCRGHGACAFDLHRLVFASSIRPPQSQ
jgi:hypothetical protein